MKRYIYIFLLISCIACQQKVGQESVLIKADDSNLKLVNGVLFYKNVEFTGKMYHFDKLNQTHDTTSYVSGKKDGREIKKYKDQSVAQERFYHKGLKIGIHKGNWENGTPKFEYHYNKNGVYHGDFKEWYSNGQLVKEFHYINGKEDGTQKMWQPDGKIRANYVVKDGERFGLIGLKKCFTVSTNNEKI